MLHFKLNEEVAYDSWRQMKLLNYPKKPEENFVKLADPKSLSNDELDEIKAKLEAANWLIYEFSSKRLNKTSLHQFAQQLSLTRFDNHTCADEGVSEISIASKDKDKGGFIPYTNRRLKWHTDGYYQPDSQWVSSIILHCNQPAIRGGVNQIVDPELLYIHLRDIEPAFITALMKPDCFKIPAYEKDGVAMREFSQGPVFWFNGLGQLQMRYTQRSKNIDWSDKPLLQEALSEISRWLQTTEQVHSVKLQAGQGILSRNVLHNRTAFQDNNSQPRQLLRARYLDPIAI